MKRSEVSQSYPCHRLVILGSKDEFVGLVNKAKQRGIYTICCDGYIDGPAKSVADKGYDIDVRQTDLVAQMCVDERADGLITSFSDTLFEQATVIADKAGLKWYATPDMLPYYREKDRAKALLAELGVKVPKNRQLSDNFKDEELEGFSYPLVIKPVDGNGSKGIFIVHSPQEIREHFSQVICRGSKPYILAEEYSKGREYNMMAWMSDGEIYLISLADRDKNPFDGKNFPVVNRVAYPAKVLFTPTGQVDKHAAVLEKAMGVLRRFSFATGQRDGALSMQFFYDNGEVEVCEIAGRFFGYEHELVKYWNGLDIEELLLDYVYTPEAARERIREYCFETGRPSAGLYFVGEHGKTIADMAVCWELAKHPCVRESNIYYRGGERIDQFGPNPYLARYYLSATTREALDQVTQYFFTHMYVPAQDGSRSDYPFILEKD